MRLRRLVPFVVLVLACAATPARAERTTITGSTDNSPVALLTGEWTLPDDHGHAVLHVQGAATAAGATRYSASWESNRLAFPRTGGRVVLDLTGELLWVEGGTIRQDHLLRWRFDQGAWQPWIAVDFLETVGPLAGGALTGSRAALIKPPRTCRCSLEVEYRLTGVHSGTTRFDFTVDVSVD